LKIRAERKGLDAPLRKSGFCGGHCLERETATIVDQVAREETFVLLENLIRVKTILHWGDVHHEVRINTP
jgi:hypothetical protein